MRSGFTILIPASAMSRIHLMNGMPVHSTIAKLSEPEERLKLDNLGVMSQRGFLHDLECRRKCSNHTRARVCRLRVDGEAPLRSFWSTCVCSPLSHGSCESILSIDSADIRGLFLLSSH